MNFIRGIAVLLLIGFSHLSLAGQELTTSNLPIIIIDTDGEGIRDEPKITAHMLILDDADGQNDINRSIATYDGFIGIEIRGQSSQSFPKKGYGVETRDDDGNDLNVALLGMPEENDWVIHSPYSDKSLIRNALAYSIAGEMMPYAPRVRLAELIINNRYEGVILWTEKIKRDNNRVAVSKLTEDDNDGDEVTGGYIIKFDKGNEVLFTSKFQPNLPYNQETRFVAQDPKISEYTDAQVDYINRYIDEFEEVLMSDNYDDPVEGYAKYIDIDSYVNTILLNELTRNVDGYRLSTYMYKDKDSKGGKLTMGPTWDHNLAWGNADYCNGSNTTGWGYDFNAICPRDFWVNHIWWERLISDDGFKQKLKKRWQSLRNGILQTSAIHQLIDDYAAQLNQAEKRNFQRWQILGNYVWPNEFVGLTYQQEINYLKNWVDARTIWLDRNFDALTGVRNIKDVVEVEIYPNPTSGTININSDIPLDKIEVYELTGRLVLSKEIPNDNAQIDLSNISTSGMVWYRILTEDADEIITGTLVID